LFLSIKGISVERPDLSTIIGIRPGNRSRIRSDSSERSSNVARVLNEMYEFGRGCIAFCIRDVVEATSDILSKRRAILLGGVHTLWGENVRGLGTYDVFHRGSIKIGRISIVELGSRMDIKPVTVYVRKDFAVPSLYTHTESVDDIQDALWIGAKVQTIVRAYHSDGALAELQEEHERHRAVLEERVAEARQEREALEARYVVALKQARIDSGEQVRAELEETIRALEQQLRNAEQRRIAVEETRRADLADAIVAERATMERIIAEKEREIGRLDAMIHTFRTAVERQTEEVRTLSASVTRRSTVVAGSKAKGSIFEQEFRDHLVHAYGAVIRDFDIKDTARGGGHEADFITTMEGEQIMWELKDYSADVPQKQVEKFLRDMQGMRGASIGVMISRSTGICGKHGPVILEVHDGRLLVYIGQFESWMESGAVRLFHLLLELFRLWWSVGVARGAKSGGGDEEGEDGELYDKYTATQKKIEENILLIQTCIAELKTRRTEWRTHKGRLEETARWVSGLLDETEMKWERLIRALRADCDESGADVNSIHSAVHVELFIDGVCDVPKNAEWAQIISDACMMRDSGVVELQELEQVLASQKRMSRDTIRQHILRIVRPERIERRGTKKVICGIVLGRGGSLPTP
jgi:hypothetical protein